MTRASYKESLRRSNASATTRWRSVQASAKQSALVDELRKSAERAAREASELRERVADSDAEVANLRRSFAQCDVRAPVKSEVLAESKIPDESEVQTPPSVVEVPAEAIAAAVLEVPAEAAVAGILDAKAQQQNQAVKQTRTRLRRTLRVTFVVVASTVVTAAIAIGARFLAVSQWRPSRPLALWRPSRPF
ncbi:hypothetical protein CTAYLR_009525 [Chrysophaeum taylorii]|uniref:Uncharacterized protein n=1 Tax=Chrysophaeum taylorii TaxID=2483200 RepID=A0AAD7XP25_9STRA|nr:hypothetical protein CTAYLR_009525 [Chrysophaeum taylorii]